MNKRDYQKAGFEHARNVQTPGRLQGTEMFPRHKDSWQAKAYWEGYDSWKPTVTGEAKSGKFVDGRQAQNLPRGGFRPGDKITFAGSNPVANVAQPAEPGSPTGRSMVSTAPNLQTINPKTVEAEKVKAAFRHPLIRGYGKSRASTDYFMHNLAGGQIKVPSAWPEGARAHAADLARQYMQELNWHRQLRLSRAVARLYTRHRAAVVAASITFVGIDEAPEITNLNQN